MDISFRQTPELFGAFHLITVSIIVLLCFPAFLKFRRLSCERLMKLLHISGIIMVIMEIWKQIFSYVYVFERVFSMWFFPWQLCSMAMYLCFLLPLFREKQQNTVLIFLSTYSLFAAIMALAVPADMLRPQILLTLHGFIYHGIMLVQSLAAMLIVYKRKEISFAKATVMFVIMAVIAETINILSHLILHDIHREPNMFNITPYYPSTQPVFHAIALKLGIISEILIYLLLIILAAWLLFRLEKKLLGNSANKTKDL